MHLFARVAAAAGSWGPGLGDHGPDVQLGLTTVTYVWNVTHSCKYHIFMILDRLSMKFNTRDYLSLTLLYELHCAYPSFPCIVKGLTTTAVSLSACLGRTNVVL